MNKIASVNAGSIAEELGIEPGDILLSINEQRVKDIIDYKYLVSDEYIELSIRKADGEEWVYEVEKEYDEDIGIVFERPIIDDARSCANKCVFCFIDQLPKGMRKTLYFKDDDSRLSFLQGNFITLTNMAESDIDRIIKYRISPLNISVHTTNPELRVKMLGNKRAGNILKILKRLAESGIDINCQIVLCRDINDGDELKNTLDDLSKLFPRVGNIAVVPVGVSRYRDNLYPLAAFDEDTSRDVINIIDSFNAGIQEFSDSPLARAADEFYIMAGYSVPGPEYYGEYEQLEDGVGMVAYFMENIESSLKNTRNRSMDREISVVTGESAYNYIDKACRIIESKVKGVGINIYKIENNFFGGKITVSGLLTGRDIIEQLKGKNLGSTLMVPSNLLKSGEEILLDDLSISDLERALNIDIKVCNFDGSDFVDRICQ